MTVSPDRASGAFFLLFGLVMYFLVVPNFVEQVDGGNLAPASMPNAISLIIAFCGGLLIFKPTRHPLPARRFFTAAGTYAAVLAAALFPMAVFGFEFVAPALALLLMLMVGERRLLWLAVGAVAVPGAIWFFVSQLLDRALP